MAQQQDFFEVELRTADGKALPVIEYEQQHWFVGEPGHEFEVAVTMANTSGSNYEVRRICFVLALVCSLSCVGAFRLHKQRSPSTLAAACVQARLHAPAVGGALRHC